MQSPEESKLKVSVCIITYNHELYIRQAIESVLEQKTNFGFEIIIADDFSKDNTRSIIDEYESLHPGLIRKIYRDRNVGPGQNFVELLYAANGNYIAYLEADDFWCDSNKLQKQTDTLDNHPECVMVHHNYLRLFNDGKQIVNPGEVKEVQDLEYILLNQKIRTGTIMFRNILKSHPLPYWYLDLSFGDWTLYMHLARFGNVIYINEIMSVYRVDSQSSFLSKIKDELYYQFHRMYHGLLGDPDYRKYTALLAGESISNLANFLVRKARSGDKATVRKLFPLFLSYKIKYLKYSLKTTFSIVQIKLFAKASLAYMKSVF